MAVGDCASDGDIFAGAYGVVGGVHAVVPVDLHIRGCPPSPRAAGGIARAHDGILWKSAHEPQR